MKFEKDFDTTCYIEGANLSNYNDFFHPAIRYFDLNDRGHYIQKRLYAFSSKSFKINLNGYSTEPNDK